MNYYKLQKDFHNYYFIVDRTVDIQHRAGYDLVTKGVITTADEISIESLADIQVFKINYQDYTDLIPMNKADFISEAMPIAVKQWRDFIELNKGVGPFLLPKKQTQSRTAISTLLGEPEVGQWFHEFLGGR
jgi:hypothetical protein